jgi:hypothetical protein
MRFYISKVQYRINGGIPIYGSPHLVFIFWNPGKRPTVAINKLPLYILYIYWFLPLTQQNLPNNSLTLLSCWLCPYFGLKHNFVTCFGFSWSHHQVIHCTNLKYCVCNLYMDLYITICPLLWSIPSVFMHSLAVNFTVWGEYNQLPCFSVF